MAGISGAIFMALFGGLSAWRWAATGSLFFALLVFRDFIMSYFFLKRKSALRMTSGMPVALSYLSTLLPLFYQSPAILVSEGGAIAANILFLSGFLLFTLATIELGSRVGISPALRDSVCRSGVYRIFRHPMYAGYMIAEAGWVIINPANSLLFVTCAGCYFFRMKAEDLCLKQAVLSIHR